MPTPDLPDYEVVAQPIPQRDGDGWVVGVAVTVVDPDTRVSTVEVLFVDETSSDEPGMWLATVAPHNDRIRAWMLDVGVDRVQADNYADTLEAYRPEYADLWAETSA